jgi:hypothetical protein
MKNNLFHRVLAKLGIIQRFARSSRLKAGTGACPGNLHDFAFETSLQDPTEFYHSCVAYFDQHLPTHLKEHRRYFSHEQRGFGEDAFHVMWSLLVDRFKPVNFLEIGVYRGQVLSLVGLLQRDHAIPGHNTGIGPFERIGDAASVTAYGHCADWLEDIQTNIAHFDLSQPQLVKALSTDPAAIETIQSTPWDMIYIDGNHDYEVVIEDWKNCAANIRPGGVIVLDDSSLDSGYQPPLFASGGFPGPSKIANSLGTGAFREILHVGHNRAFQKVG